jgi:signal peptidase I
VWLAAILGGISGLLYLFVFDTWIVAGDDPLFVASVQPTIAPGERLLTRRGSAPNFGELARCTAGDGSGRLVVGRVFGREGDTVEINNERVGVNGRYPSARHGCTPVSVVHPVSGEPVSLLCSVEDNGAFTYGVLVHGESREGRHTALVEPGKLFLVSDNRHIHMDSRDFGQVDASTCEHVVFRLWGQSFVDGAHRFNILW